MHDLVPIPGTMPQIFVGGMGPTSQKVDSRKQKRHRHTYTYIYIYYTYILCLFNCCKIYSALNVKVS